MALASPAKGKSLDNDYGSSAGGKAPASHQVAIFNGDPTAGGTELTGTSGVSRLSVTNDGTNWPDSVSDVKSNGVKLDHTASTGAWASSGDYVALIDPVTSEIWDYKGPIPPISVTGAGQTVSWDIGQLAMTT